MLMQVKVASIATESNTGDWWVEVPFQAIMIMIHDDGTTGAWYTRDPGVSTEKLTSAEEQIRF